MGEPPSVLDGVSRTPGSVRPKLGSGSQGSHERHFPQLCKNGEKPATAMNIGGGVSANVSKMNEQHCTDAQDDFIFFVSS